MALATGLVALHVADDSFIQPASGTSAADHLAGGLTPIAALALGAWAYPRVRKGARALIALSSGFFGILIGASEAGYYALKVGPSGDDYSGLLAVPAGVFLLGLGPWTLWRSRRLDTWRRRYLRRALIAVASVVVVFYSVTHVARPYVPTADLGTAYEDVQFETSDGLTLYGWYIPSGTPPTCHGAHTGSNRPSSRPTARSSGGWSTRAPRGSSTAAPRSSCWSALKTALSPSSRRPACTWRRPSTEPWLPLALDEQGSGPRPCRE